MIVGMQHTHHSRSSLQCTILGLFKKVGWSARFNKKFEGIFRGPLFSDGHVVMQSCHNIKLRSQDETTNCGVCVECKAKHITGVKVTADLALPEVDC
jgi:hypothetical protein